jgi:hypothetical protein
MPRAADDEHAQVNPMKSAGRNAPRYRRIAQADASQLVAGDRPVLWTRDRRDPMIRRCVHAEMLIDQVMRMCVNSRRNHAASCR